MFLRLLKRYVQDERGVTAVEYGLLLAILTVGTLSAMISMRDEIINVFTTAADTMRNSSSKI